MLAHNIRDAWITSSVAEDFLFATRDEADLKNADQVGTLMRRVKPRLVIHLAARVAGFAERKARPFEFLDDNVVVDCNVVHAALETGVDQMLYVGSALAYPATSAGVKSTEDDFFRSGFSSLSDNYGLAKAVGMRLIQSAAAQYGAGYRVIVPTNLYGPHDHFSSHGGHVVPAAIVKAHDACKTASGVPMMGDGRDERQFTFAPDLARWITGIVNDVDSLPSLLNVGGDSISTVHEVYDEAIQLAGCGSRIEYDLSFSSSPTSQLLDSSKAREFGWAQSTSLSAGMAQTHEWFLSHVARR